VEKVIDRQALGVEFRSPESFVYDPSRDEFLVADTLNRRIVIFLSSGQLQAVLDLGKSRVSPLSIALGPGERILATDQESGDLAILDFRGRVEARLTGRDLGLEQPVCLGALCPDEAGFLWAVDRRSGDLVRVSIEENRASRFSPQYPEDGYWKIADLYREPAGPLWLLSSIGPAIQAFHADMSPIIRFGSHGPQNHQVSFPAGFCVGPRGHFWIVDKFRHRVAIFSREGGFLGTVGQGGTGKGSLRFPTDCLFLSDTQLAVLDGGNSRVQTYRLQ